MDKTIKIIMWISLILLSVFIIMIVLFLIFPWNWAEWTGFNTKTLWDFLELLIIPLTLTLIAILFNISQRKSEEWKSNEQIQERYLQSYIEKMSELLIKQDLLNKYNQGDPVEDVAQVITITTLRLLDVKRRDIILRFLGSANMLEFIFKGQTLDGIDLSNSLVGFCLNHASLRNANLSHSYLGKLEISELDDTDFSHSNLYRASFEESNMIEISFNYADLRKSNFYYCEMDYTYFINSDCRNANFRKCKFNGANFNLAKLFGADFSDATITNTSFLNAKIKMKQLFTVKGLINVTLPDGHVIKNVTGDEFRGNYPIMEGRKLSL